MIGRRTFLADAGATLAAAPRFARAQDEKVPRIAMVHASRPVEHLSQTGQPRCVAFHDELRRLGLREGET